MTGVQWHALSVDDSFKELRSSKNGLTNEDVAARLATHGPNELSEAKHTSPLRLFMQQFTDFLVIILLIAAAISAFIGWHENTKEELYDAAVIMVIVMFNAIFGFVQEYKAEKALAAL